MPKSQNMHNTLHIYIYIICIYVNIYKLIVKGHKF